MKHILLAALFVVSGMALSAQPGAEWSAMAAQGGTDRNQNIQLEWTLGEMATATGVSDRGMLTEGFHQPVLQVVKILTAASADVPSDSMVGLAAGAIDIYPNPTAGRLQISITDGSASLIRIALMDNTGRFLTEQRVQTPGALEMDLRPYPPGTYLLRIQSAAGTCNQVYQVIKQ